MAQREGLITRESMQNFKFFLLAIFIHLLLATYFIFSPEQKKTTAPIYLDGIDIPTETKSNKISPPSSAMNTLLNADPVGANENNSSSAANSVATGMVEISNFKAAEYPLISRKMNEEGNTTIEFITDKNGLAQNIIILKSSQHPRLDRAAIDTISKNKYPPNQKQKITIEFRLHE